MTTNISESIFPIIQLPEGWTLSPISSLAKFNPAAINGNYPHKAIEYLDIANVSSGSYSNPTTLQLENAPSRAKRIVVDNDVILSTVRPGNRAYAFMRDVKPNLIVSTGFAVLQATNSDSRYLYYIVTSNPVIDYLASIAEEKTAYPSVNPSDIEEIIVPVPPLSEQRAIAHILGTLDDKIDLNRRMNETLEGIVRALFKSWFIDFDPVRAKAEGKQPFGMDQETAALFPNEFENSELGEIPKGWTITKLSDICTTQYGFTASAEEAPIGPKLLRVTDINKTDHIIWDNVPHCAIPGELLQKYKLAKGDLVVARMADPGKSAIIDDNTDAIFASYLVRLRTDSLACNYFIHGFLKSNVYQQYAEEVRGGSVQANMNAQVIVGCPLVKPNSPIIENYYKTIIQIREKITSNLTNNSTLYSLRDSLLPKLISGAIRVDPSKFGISAKKEQNGEV